ncbi:IS3 family transposase [Listeria immobilis]|uniref:IS3 family transposase n=1 Tax=Listeria immobilis TaxID=2713502 RepID=UPI001623E4BE|nr:IS3 family transposase [Listeria immobilis]MBC1517152.1 transposase [Listeria immobilis]MBC6298328.1 transposase [Listeria immobilis]
MYIQKKWDEKVVIKREILTDKQFHTKAQAKLGIINYLEIYYNYKRIYSSLNYLTPHKFEVSNKFS